ncbi:MAG: TonB-dependent receptor, partial [Bacteroidia bacterium]|nr:TonB-dependent receptor [Bacteroidia bacterium]
GADFNWNKFAMHINLFHMQYDNQLVLTGEVNGDGFNIKRNVKESYRQGLESMFAYKFSDKLEARVSSMLGNTNIKKFEHLVPDYDNGGTFNNGTTTGSSISFSPNIIANGTISYSPINYLKLNFATKYVGEQFLDNTANPQNILDAYTVADFSIEYNIKIKGIENIKLGVLINNVFNEEYESNGYAFSYFSYNAPVTDRYYFPQAGTNVLGRITIDF